MNSPMKETCMPCAMKPGSSQNISTLICPLPKLQLLECSRRYKNKECSESLNAH